MLFPFQYPSSRELLNFRSVGKNQKEHGNYPRTGTWLWRKYQIAGNTWDLFFSACAVIMSIFLRCLYVHVCWCFCVFFPDTPLKKKKIIHKSCHWRPCKDLNVRYSLSGVSILSCNFLLHWYKQITGMLEMYSSQRSTLWQGEYLTNS